jgi:hypothetical protein
VGATDIPGGQRSWFVRFVGGLLSHVVGALVPGEQTWIPLGREGVTVVPLEGEPNGSAVGVVPVGVPLSVVLVVVPPGVVSVGVPLGVVLVVVPPGVVSVGVPLGVVLVVVPPGVVSVGVPLGVVLVVVPLGVVVVGVAPGVVLVVPLGAESATTTAGSDADVPQTTATTHARRHARGSRLGAFVTGDLPPRRYRLRTAARPRDVRGPWAWTSDPARSIRRRVSQASASARPDSPRAARRAHEVGR